MNNPKTVVIGVGATGAVLAASLLVNNPEVMLVDPRPGLAEAIEKDGLHISGELALNVPVRNFFGAIRDMKAFASEVIFVSTKTFHFPAVLEELKHVVSDGVKIISTHNGLGTEDLIADIFGNSSAFRMSLNYGVALKGQTHVEMAFFNRPNHLGALDPENYGVGKDIAAMLSSGGLETACVDNIKRFVWKKMIMKCTMASICAVTDMTIKDALDFPPTREIAEGCFQEILSIAKAKGFDLGPDYLAQAMSYLEKVGIHKDSMCVDIANKTRTEIDFLGGKVVQYGKETHIATPFFATMANLVRTMENSYLR